VVIEAHTRLEMGLAEWGINPPTRTGRQHRLSLVADVVREEIAAVRAQRALVIEQKALSALRSNGEKS
jgi:hypothetical protein